MKLRNKIIIAILLLLVPVVWIAATTDVSRYIIFDEAVTTSNDTLQSGWVWIGSAPNVAIFYSTDDTMYVKGDFRYRYGTGSGSYIASLTADTLSLDTRSTAATGLSKGKVLRGYGSATDLIPGANYIWFEVRRQAGSETTGSFYMGLQAE